MKVLVCDDLQDRCEEAVKAVKDGCRMGTQVVPLFGPELKLALEKLFKNVDTHLKEGKERRQTEITAFDEADLVIVDNNLAHLGIEGTRLTAESIAGYIRGFSAAPYIVSLNKNPDVDFDLRYLVGDYATKTDLAINDRHLANPGLWNGKLADALNGFRPWYWPTLCSIPERRRAQITFVLDRFDEPVLGACGFPDDVITFLSLHARGALTPGATSDGAVGDNDGSIQMVTFRDVFIASNRSIPDKREREKLSEDSKDLGEGTAARDVIARVVAADIDLWFRRDVLGPQEALADLSHLLARMPFLLGRKGNGIKHWNKAITESAEPFGIEQKFFDDHVAKTRFRHDIWIPSPAFWWPQLKTDDTLNELFFAPEQDWPDAVFCEDRSMFFERSPKDGAGPVEFAAEFEGSWSRRFVSRIPDIRYAPRSRFAV